MASYRLSDKADEDLSRLYEYGIIHYGQERADRYYNGLIEGFEELAETPGCGFVGKDAIGVLQVRLRRRLCNRCP